MGIPVQAESCVITRNSNRSAFKKASEKTVKAFNFLSETMHLQKKKKENFEQYSGGQLYSLE